MQSTTPEIQTATLANGKKALFESETCGRCGGGGYFNCSRASSSPTPPTSGSRPRPRPDRPGGRLRRRERVATIHIFND